MTARTITIEVTGIPEVKEMLARLDGLRVTCPTCDGKTVVVTPETVGKAFFAVLDKGKGAGVPHLECPDCVDGRMSHEWAWKIVAALYGGDLVVMPRGAGVNDVIQATREALQRVQP